MKAKSQLVAEGWSSPFSRHTRAKACTAKSCMDSGTVIYWILGLIFTCRFSHWDAQLSHNSRQGWAAARKFITSAERIHPSELKCLCMNQSWISLPGWSFHLQGLTKQKELARARAVTGIRTPFWGKEDIRLKDHTAEKPQLWFRLSNGSKGSVPSWGNLHFWHLYLPQGQVLCLGSFCTVPAQGWKLLPLEIRIREITVTRKATFADLASSKSTLSLVHGWVASTPPAVPLSCSDSTVQ